MWITGGTPESEGLPCPRVDLLPQLVLPGADGSPEARTDTTPRIRELERRYNGRSVIPEDPVVAFLLANADARARGSERLACEIDAQAWVQRPFPYQAKCLGWLRETHAGLATTERTTVDTIFATSGCERLFA